MPDFQALTLRIERLSQGMNRWNTAMIWALVFTALAAIAVVVTTSMALVRAKQLARAQTELSQAKDNQVALDLKEKDVKIAELIGEAEKEKLARVRLEDQVSPRRLTGEQKTELTKLLEKYPDTVGIVIVSTLLDTESSDFADDFDAAIGNAKWKTMRFKDRLTQNTGISLGVFEGTPELDPWGRPITKLKQRIGDALKAIGVSYHDVTFGKDDLHSTSVQFQSGPIYLVVEHKPPIHVEQQK